MPSPADDDQQALRVTLWSDYICPWCYLGRDRTALLVSMGCDVELLPYELHPDLPLAGRAVRPGGRLAAVHDDIARQCAEVGMPFRAPTHVPNSRRALETAEVVRAAAPESFAELDDALFSAHFVDGRDIGDPVVLDEVVEAAGGDASAVRSRVEAGGGRTAVDASMARAIDHGVGGTPAWLFGDDLVIPGAQPRELFTRIVNRLRARTGDTPSGPVR